MSHATSSKCNMTLIKQPGEEELLIFVKKPHSFHTANAHFFMENSPNYLFLGKQEPQFNK